jgi:CheY-like chemotaxis protein
MPTTRVLVVDDEDVICMMMREGLQRDGFEVVTASNVSDALQYIATEKFDVLLSDLQYATRRRWIHRGQRHAPYSSQSVDSSS